jgi:hypothetical protein
LVTRMCSHRSRLDTVSRVDTVEVVWALAINGKSMTATKSDAAAAIPIFPMKRAVAQGAAVEFIWAFLLPR